MAFAEAARWHIDCDQSIRILEKITAIRPVPTDRWTSQQIRYHVERLESLLKLAPARAALSVAAYKARLQVTQT